MGYKRYISLFQLRNRPVVHCKRISSSDILRCPFMYRLKPKLHPDRFDPVKLIQKIQNIFRQAVRSRGDRQPHNIRMVYRLGKKASKFAYRGIRIRKSLEICNILSVLYFPRYSFFAFFNLLRYGKLSAFGKVSASSRRAKNTPTGRYLSVPVWAGKSAV